MACYQMSTRVCVPGAHICECSRVHICVFTRTHMCVYAHVCSNWTRVCVPGEQMCVPREDISMC